MAVQGKWFGYYEGQWFGPLDEPADVRASWFQFNPTSASVCMAWGQFNTSAIDVRMSWAAAWSVVNIPKWDDTQGVARNLANNLKYKPISDIEHRCVPTGSESGAGVVKVFASAVVKTTTEGAYSGARPVSATSSRFKANAFVRASASGVTSRCINPSVSADCSIGGAVVGSTSGVLEAPAMADAKVRPGVTMQGLGWASPLVYAYGVKNPSDEEVAILMTNLVRKHLLTRKQSGRLYV